MTWDPVSYLQFADARARPGVDLLARIPLAAPRSVVDAGCGAGNLTALIAERWPSADVRGFDSSPEMIERAARDHPSLHFWVDDLASWEPDDPIDVLYTNATLHWLDDHAMLFPRLMSYIAPGGVLAVQMPDNWSAPTHRIPADILDDGPWPESARAALMRNRLATPSEYLRWLAPAEVDLWRTTYYQRLAGVDPVWEWVTGSVLRPVLAALDTDSAERFSAECRRSYRDAYPADDSGTTLLPFSRLFLVAAAGST